MPRWLIALIFLTTVALADPICEGVTGYVPYPIVGNTRTIGTVQLTPGHWDCVVSMDLNPHKATIAAAMLSLNLVAGKMADFPATSISGPNGGPGFGLTLSSMPLRLNVTAPVTYYINTVVYFDGGPEKGTVNVRSAYHCTNVTLTN